jgi:hypothetical protein
MPRVDFEAVIRNAEAQGVDLQEIAIQYEGLTPDDLIELRLRQHITHNRRNGTVLAKFPGDGGIPSCPEKAVAVHYLGA